MSLPSLHLNYLGERSGAIAVICGDKIITYEKLRSLSTKIAFALHANGVRRGNRVVILTSRCIGMVVLFHAVLEVGACYIPLDLEGFSSDRISHVIDTVKPAVIASSEPVDNLGRKVLLYNDLIGSTHASTAVPSIMVAEEDLTSVEDLAYIAFTSGTTSAPKGVMVPRSALLNYVRQDDPPFNISVRPPDMVLCIFSPAFDGTINHSFLIYADGE